MTVDVLAARYRRLLVCYPRWYRQQRGEEVVGTLLEGARPGQVRPAAREAWVLVVEGLRLRAGTSAHRTARASLVGGLQVAVLLLVAAAVLRDGTALGVGPSAPVPLPEPARWVFAAVLVLFEMTLFWLVATGRFGSAVPVAVVTGVVSTVGYPVLLDEPVPVMFRLLVTSAVLTVACVVAMWLLSRHGGGLSNRHRRRITAGPVMLAWAFVPPLTLALADYVETLSYPDTWVVVQSVLVSLYLGALAYAGIDPRPALAVAFTVTIFLVRIVAMAVPLTDPPDDLLVVVSGYLAVAASAGVAGWLGLWRQRRARPLAVPPA